MEGTIPMQEFYLLQHYVWHSNKQKDEKEKCIHCERFKNSIPYLDPLINNQKEKTDF